MISDGYYLSVYSSIDPIVNFYKGELRHDHNFSLWYKEKSKIRLVHHWELERISGYKRHKISFYSAEDFYNFANKQLNRYGLKCSDMNGIIGTPNIDTLKNYYMQDFGTKFTYHSATHLFSAMLMNSNIFYENTIIALALDGGSDPVIDRDVIKRNQFMGAVSIRANIKYFSVSSPGQLWGIARYIFGLEEGTLMALAYASDSRSLESAEVIISDIQAETYKDLRQVGKIIRKIKQRIYSYNKILDKGKKFNYFDERFTDEENRISMIMKIIQEISLKMVDRTIENIIDKFNIDPQSSYIALSGGYALNCPTNTHIMHKYKFKGQLIPPFANDGGQAIGMGLYYFYKNLRKFTFSLDNAFYGDDDYSIDGIIKSQYYKEFIKSVDYSTSKFVDDIVELPVIWFDGRAEIGPRALGHRSILADPRSEKSKDLINKYKQRQWWRPVAPIVLEEELDNWFQESFRSPFMLNNFFVKEDKANLILSALHLDKSARVQTINQYDNKTLYELVRNFYEKTGIPLLCNTSLNDKGEPIINTIKQAMNFALRKGIGIIYINGIRLVLHNFELFDKDVWEKREEREFISYCEEDISKYNPHNLSIQEYLLYLKNPMLQNLNILNENDVKHIKKVYSKISGLYLMKDM